MTPGKAVPPGESATPYQARDELRGLLLGAAAAAVPGGDAVVVFDPGPTPAGALCDGATRTASSRIRVETGTGAGRHDERIAAARRHLTGQGWSVVRSGGTDEVAELVAVRAGYTMHVTGRADARRLVLVGETPPTAAVARAVSGPGSG